MSLEDAILALIEALDRNTAAQGGEEAAPAEKKPAAGRPRSGTTGKPGAAKTVKLEEVQDAIRALVAADGDNKTAIKAAIKKIDKTAERAGDFEDSPDKLKKLLDALTAMGGDDDDNSGDEDDDVL